jgi:polysaccharide export outer membrane protein
MKPLLLFLVAAAVSASSAAGQSSGRPSSSRPAQQGASQARPAPAAPGQAPAAQAPTPYDREGLTADYRIATGDVLQVFVWKEPELSREVRVRPDGYVTISLLGDVFAVGKTPKVLAAELGQALSQYVNSPLVTITLGESSTLRFYVVGEVNKPGEYPLIGRVTVMQALAQAAGLKEYAKGEEVKLLRQELGVLGGKTQTREIVLSINYKALTQGQNLHQNFVLRPGDVIVVP